VLFIDTTDNSLQDDIGLIKIGLKMASLRPNRGHILDHFFKNFTDFQTQIDQNSHFPVIFRPNKWSKYHYVVLNFVRRTSFPTLFRFGRLGIAIRLWAQDKFSKIWTGNSNFG